MLSPIVRRVVLALVAGFAPLALAAPTEQVPSPPARADKIRVLIVTGGHDFERDAFFKMFSGQPDITWQEAVQPEAQKWFAPDKANEYDVMVWYDMYQEISEEAKKDLLALFAKGKPLVALHHSAGSYQNWPEALNIVGARFYIKPEGDHAASDFKHDIDLHVKVADTSHPITRFMADFDIHDEGYKGMAFLAGTKPLLTTDHPASDKVVGWTHTYKNSPVVYLQLGHDHLAYENPNYRRLIAQSIRWAAGRLPDPSEEGFGPLFDGKSLQGWTVLGDPAGFVARNGILRSDLPYKGEWVRTNRLFGDFILRVQWRVSKDGNSGVFVRAKDKDPQNLEGSYPWNTGSEIQISNAPRDIAHCTGSLYGTVAVDPRPNESAEVWHEFEIHCRGPHYRVFADNVPVVDVDARSVPALYAKPLIGYVGLQDNHSENGWIEYRNVSIKELKMTAGDATAWRLGTQTYTFNRFTLFEAIDKAKALGLKYIEAYPGQKLSPDEPNVSFSHDASVEVLDKVKRKLADAGISLVCYGVVRLEADDAAARKVFEFARLMGIETITAEPAEGAFDLIDRLTEEYSINAAIHNHPRRPDDPSYVYWNPDEVLKLIERENKRVGVCADTGHWMRSGLDPVECLKKLEGRIISLHFKDLNKIGPDAHDVPWGTGAGNAKAMLAELHRQGFKGAFSIEYEHKWENNMPDVAECIKYFNEVAKELGY